MDENSFNAVSHSAKADMEGALKRHRNLLLLGAALFSLGYVFICTIVIYMPQVLIGLVPIWYVFYKITWWRLSYDYEYSIAGGGILTVEKLYNHAHRKKLLEVRLKDAVSIAPHKPGDKAPVKPCYDFRGSPKTPDGYCVVYRDAEGKECAALIEVSAKLLRMMTKFNPATVQTTDLRF